MFKAKRVAVDSTSPEIFWHTKSQVANEPQLKARGHISADTKGPTKRWVPCVELHSGVCSKGFVPAAAIIRKMNEL